jgi:hypothetical protein
VYYSNSVWYVYETTDVNNIVFKQKLDHSPDNQIFV